MKKWMYLIFPGAMLAVFLVFFLAHEKESAQREADRKVAIAKKAADEKSKKDEAEKKAKDQALAQAKQRDDEERKKVEDRRAKQAAADKAVRDETNAFVAEGDKFQKEAAALEIELDRLHKEKDRIGREAFDMAKQVELGKVARRNAELDGARMTEMIARRASMSSMASPPPPPPPPPAK